MLNTPLRFNRATRRANYAANRGSHGVRWNKGGYGWRQRAMKLGQQRARQRVRDGE
jgi:hypothetical protein